MLSFEDLDLSVDTISDSGGSDSQAPEEEALAGVARVHEERAEDKRDVSRASKPQDGDPLRPS